MAPMTPDAAHHETASSRYEVEVEPRRPLPRPLVPVLDLVARVIEARYAIRVPGAPTRLRIRARATGAVVASYDVSSTDAITAQILGDLASLDARAFERTWCNLDRRPAEPVAPEDARRRLRADLRFAAGVALLATWPLLRVLRRGRRGSPPAR
jgi:hypothetical protein